MGELSSALWGVLASPEGSMGLPGIPVAPVLGAVGTEFPLIKLFKPECHSTSWGGLRSADHCTGMELIRELSLPQL